MDNGFGNTNNVVVGGTSSLVLVYSASEQELNVSWIDGKPVYRITVTGTITQSAGSQVGKSIYAGIDTLIDVAGYWNNGVNAIPLASQSISGTYKSLVYKQQSSGIVMFYSVSDNVRTNSPYSIILTYTKT
jgi:hypothetical protein